MEIKKIFISHSYQDRYIADRLIDKLIVPFFGIDKKKDIFYTSKRLTGIKASLNWKEQIKTSLKECEIFIALITPNYKNSEMCTREIGAAWVLNKCIYPLILPPVTFENFSVIISELQAENLSKSDNVKSFLDSLKTDLSKFFEILNHSEQEELEIINKFRKSLRSYLRKKPFDNLSNHLETKVSKQTRQNNEINLKANIENNDTSAEMKIVMEESLIEWPDDYEMQLHYINKQKNALRQLDRILNGTSNPELINILYNKAKKEWPRNYEMQVHTLEKQIDAYKEIRKNNL